MGTSCERQIEHMLHQLHEDNVRLLTRIASERRHGHSVIDLKEQLAFKRGEAYAMHEFLVSQHAR